MSFGVVRLLDGAAYAVERQSLYWPHLVWVALKLVQHFNIWWTLWSRHEASWTYAGFLAQLGPPLVLYLQATTLVTASPQSIESWREHYYSVRQRFFALNLMFGLANPLAAVAVGVETESLAAPFFVAAISAVGLVSSSHRVHSVLAIIALLSNVLLVTILTLNPATRPFG